MTEPSPAPFRLAYRLTEADVRRYCTSGRVGKCWRACRRRKTALLLMVALGGFLIGACLRSQGPRAGGIALGTMLIVLGALAIARDARSGHHACRLASALGLPRDFRLAVSPEGIAEGPGPEVDDPARTFAWPEVVGIERVDHLTIIRVRPAGGVLIVPDSAFDRAAQRLEFARLLAQYRGQASKV